MNKEVPSVSGYGKLGRTDAWLAKLTYSWLTGTRDKGFLQPQETEEPHSPHIVLWVAILPSLWEMRSSKSVLPAISSWNSLCTAVEGHKVACYGADSSSFLPCCHYYICLWLLVQPLLDVWTVFALEDFSLFTLFLPKVKNSPQMRWMTHKPLSLGRQPPFLPIVVQLVLELPGLLWSGSTS